MKRSKTLPDFLNTEKICLSGFVFAMVLLSGSVAFALDPIGPPIADLEPGQFQLGLDMSSSKTDLILNNGKWVEYRFGSVIDSGQSNTLTINDFEQNSNHLNFGYGIDYNWKAFFRLSSTNAEFGDSIWNAGEKFDSDNVPAFGGGLKATFYERNYLKIGAVAQANWSSYSGQLNSPLWDAPHFVETNMMEIQITLGAAYMWTDSICIYGGPLFQLIKGEFDYSFIDEANIGGLLVSEYSWDIEEDSMYGGYIGTQVEIAKDWYLNMEYQMTGAASGFGASIVAKF